MATDMFARMDSQGQRDEFKLRTYREGGQFSGTHGLTFRLDYRTLIKHCLFAQLNCLIFMFTVEVFSHLFICSRGLCDMRWIKVFLKSCL